MTRLLKLSAFSFLRLKESPRRLQFLPLGGEVEQGERVVHQVQLDLLVERAVGAVGGEHVHLQHEGPHFVVQDDVEPQDLEAHGVFQVVWLAGPVRVLQAWLH